MLRTWNQLSLKAQYNAIKAAMIVFWSGMTIAELLLLPSLTPGPLADGSVESNRLIAVSDLILGLLAGYLLLGWVVNRKGLSMNHVFRLGQLAFTTMFAVICFAMATHHYDDFLANLASNWRWSVIEVLVVVAAGHLMFTMVTAYLVSRTKAASFESAPPATGPQG